jgi:hypothetical protein
VLSKAKLDVLVKLKVLVMMSVSFLVVPPIMAQSLYCPQNSGYINTGMTQQQVMAACGQPLAKQESNNPVTQKVPVTQLIYTTLNQGSVYSGLNSAFYTQWNLPSGTAGIGLEINIMNNKVSSIKINGSGTNAMSVCGGKSVQIGDNANVVYSACGSPSMVNNSYINQVVPSNTKPEVWIYQVNQYQSPISLTFINGKLQSIN